MGAKKRELRYFPSPKLLTDEEVQPELLDAVGRLTRKSIVGRCSTCGAKVQVPVVVGNELDVEVAGLIFKARTEVHKKLCAGDTSRF